MKFVIVSPRQMCGGPIVLHALCKYLSELGHDSKIFYNYGLEIYERRHAVCFWIRWLRRMMKDTIKLILVLFPRYRDCFPGYGDVPVKGCRRKYLPWVDEDTIVVYPESVYGDYFHAKKVVRWFLYHNRYKEDPEGAYSADDMFISYREVFNDSELNPKGLTVHTPYFDLNTYRQYNFGVRKGTCYIVRKGIGRPDLPESFDGILIDSLSEKEKVKIFNECEYCISYDTQTAYSGIAAMCGCVSIVVPEPGKQKTDYKGKDDKTIGVAWSFAEEEINYAKSTRHLIKENYEKMNKESKKAAEAFVKMCEEYFEKKTMLDHADDI